MLRLRPLSTACVTGCAAPPASPRATSTGISRSQDCKRLQFTVLATLMGRKEMGVTELSDWLVIERTGLLRNLRILETRGLIDIRPGTDKRQRRLSLTRRGRAAAMRPCRYGEKRRRRRFGRFLAMVAKAFYRWFRLSAERGA